MIIFLPAIIKNNNATVFKFIIYVCVSKLANIQVLAVWTPLFASSSAYVQLSRSIQTGLLLISRIWPDSPNKNPSLLIVSNGICARLLISENVCTLTIGCFLRVFLVATLVIAAIFSENEVCNNNLIYLWS